MDDEDQFAAFLAIVMAIAIAYVIYKLWIV